MFTKLLLKILHWLNSRPLYRILLEFIRSEKEKEGEETCPVSQNVICINKFTLKVSNFRSFKLMIKGMNLFVRR